MNLLFPDSYVGSRLWSWTVTTQINLAFSKENYNVSRGSLSTNTEREISLPKPHLFLQGVLCMAVYQLYENKSSPVREFHGLLVFVVDNLGEVLFFKAHVLFSPLVYW